MGPVMDRPLVYCPVLLTAVLCCCSVNAGSVHGYDVFLGGSCNPTTWRKDVAIPYLQEAGVSFYNPVGTHMQLIIKQLRFDNHGKRT